MVDKKQIPENKINWLLIGLSAGIIFLQVNPASAENFDEKQQAPTERNLENKSHIQKTLPARLLSEDAEALAVEQAKKGDYGIIAIQQGSGDGPDILPGLDLECSVEKTAVLPDFRLFTNEDTALNKEARDALSLQEKAKEKIAAFNKMIVSMPDFPEPYACSPASDFWGDLFSKPVWKKLGISEEDYQKARAAKMRTARYFYPLSKNKQDFLKKITKAISAKSETEASQLSDELAKIYPIGSNEKAIRSDFISRKYTFSEPDKNYCPAGDSGTKMTTPTNWQQATVQWCTKADGRISKLRVGFGGFY